MGERAGKTGIVVSAGDRWILAILVAALVLGGWLRLDGIRDIGLTGSDNTYYTNIAELWTEGERVYDIGRGPGYFRPVVYWVFSQSIRLLGFNDWSIKTVNATLDTVNILLVFLLAWVLSRRNLRPAVAAAVVYALLPFTILMARSEQTHVLSTLLLLVSTLLFALAWFTERQAASFVLIFLAGAATGLCALTHEEMIFTAAAPGLMCVLAFPTGDGGRAARLLGAAVRGGVYLSGTFLGAHGMLRTHQAGAQLRAGEIMTHRVEEALYLRFVERPLKFGWNAVVGSSSTVLACLVVLLALGLVIAAAIRLRREWRGQRLSGLRIEDLPLFIVILHLVLFAFFFTYYATRLFIPLIPLLIIWLIVRSAALIERWRSPSASHLALPALTAILVITNLGHIGAYHDSRYSHFNRWTRFSLATDLRPAAGWALFQQKRTNPTWARRRFEELGPMVGDDARLLVGASTFHPFPGRRLLQVDYYFGDNAVYLYDHDQPIDRLIDDKSISFVIFTAYQTVWQGSIEAKDQQRYLYNGRWGPREPIVLGRSLGLGNGEYTIQREFELLRSQLANRGARVIHGRGELLTLRPPSFGTSSFIVWALDPQRGPALASELDAIEKSIALAAEHRLADAIEILGEAENETNDWGRFRLRLTGARLYAEDQRPGKARRQIDAALSLLPRNTTVATMLRDIYPTREETDQALDLFAGVQTDFPASPPIRNLMLGLAVNLVELAIEVGDSDAASDAFSDIDRQLKIPGQRQYIFAIAEWCTTAARALARGGHRDAAEAGLAAASTGYRQSLDPGSLPSPLMLALTGATLSDIGRSDLAIEPLEKAAEDEPGNAGIWAHLCLAHQRNGDLDRAAAACHHAISVDPNHFWVRLIFAELLGRRGLWPKALNEARVAASSPPSGGGHTVGLTNFARRASEAGRNAEACDLLLSIRRPEDEVLSAALVSLGCSENADPTMSFIVDPSANRPQPRDP